MSLRFALTEPLRAKLESAIVTLSAAPSASSSASDDVVAFQSALCEGSINLQDAKSLSAHLRAEAKAAAAKESDPEAAAATLNQPLQFVHELLQGAAPVLPERTPKPPPHPSLAPRLEKLRAAQEDREYAKLIGRNLARDATSDGRDTAEMATYRSQLGVGVNLIVSMATMFIVGAYAGGVEGEPFLCVRATICGLILMLLTMAVEMSLFLIGAIRVDDQVHKREQRAKKGLSDRTKLAQHQQPSGSGSGGSGGSDGGRPLSVKAD